MADQVRKVAMKISQSVRIGVEVKDYLGKKWGEKPRKHFLIDNNAGWEIFYTTTGEFREHPTFQPIRRVMSIMWAYLTLIEL